VLLLVRREVVRIFRFGKWRLWLLVRNWRFGRMNDDESEYEIGIVFIEEMEIGIGMVLFETLIIKHQNGN